MIFEVTVGETLLWDGVEAKRFTPKVGAAVFRGKEMMTHVIGADVGKCKGAITVSLVMGLQPQFVFHNVSLNMSACDFSNHF